MQTEVAILHHDYPARVRDMVEEKLQRLSRFYEKTVSMRAMLERQNEQHRVEIVAGVGQGAVLVVDARGDALTKAVDEAMERMGRLLKKHNSRMSTNRRRSRTVVEPEV